MKRITILLSVFLFTMAGFAGSPTLKLKTGTFDPLTTVNREVQSSQFFINSYPKGQLRLHIVQFEGPVSTATRELLEKNGCRVMDYIPNYAYAVFATPETIGKLKLKHLRWKGIFQTLYRISPEVLTIPKGKKPVKQDEELRLRIQFYPIFDDAVTQYRLREAGAVVEKWGSSKWQQSAILRIKRFELENLAILPGLKWIEEYHEPVLHST